jgi:hypothetical protein
MGRLFWSVSVGIALLGSSSMRAGAAAVELKPRPLIDALQQQVRCPEKVVAYQTARPYQEGSFAWDGTVNLRAIATQVSRLKVDPFSVTWVGTLKSPFQNCRAAAGVVKVDGQPSEQSYLRMQFLKGKVYFILDMTGLTDANSLTPAILHHEVVQGNPRWRWGGTD